MKRQLRVEVNDMVILNRDVEVTPFVIIEKGTIGKVKEETFPYWFKICFFENGIYWVDGNKLDVIFR